MPGHVRILLTIAAICFVAGCGGDENRAGGHGGPGGQGGHGAGGPPRGGPPGVSAAVPVEVAEVERRTISSYLETNGTLEAENEVDLVARVAAPIVELRAEEGMQVRRGQALARLEDVELRAQVEIARVALNEATLTFDRAKKLFADSLIPEEEFERASANFESATAQLRASEILLGYTDVAAPFDGLIVTRYVDLAEQVSVNTPLFRLSDFTPLLCPIQVPERELSKLHVGQPARLTFEPWPDRVFQAEVLRISPVVDAATGTIKVTLDVDAEGKLRPGMFASVFLETDTRDGALVIPKAALSLESIGDTVYVASDGKASRREVTLGFREGDYVEVTEGLGEGETIVVVGHDGLSDGTPVKILGARDDALAAAPPATGPPGRPGGGDRSPVAGAGPRGGPPGPGGPGGPGGPPDFSQMTPEQLERARERMRARGMSEEEIEARIAGEREQAEPHSR
jgi:RND family efflux transporter MFP subunit